MIHYILNYEGGKSIDFHALSRKHMGLSAQQLSQPLRLGHLRGDPRRLLRCLERPHGKIQRHHLNRNQKMGTGHDLRRLVLLAERGIMVSYETVRRWVNHFGPMIAADLCKRRPKPYTTWHLDEVYLKIDGRMVYLWRAVDAEGEVLDVLVQAKRNKQAALKLMRKLLKRYGFVPDKIVTDELRS